MLELALGAGPPTVDVGDVLLRARGAALRRGLARAAARARAGPARRRSRRSCSSRRRTSCRPAASATSTRPGRSAAGAAATRARPWLAENAIELAAQGADGARRRLELPRQSSTGRCRYRPVVSATRPAGRRRLGTDPRRGAVANVNSPLRTRRSRRRRPSGCCARWCEPHGELADRGNAPRARSPPTRTPLGARLLAARRRPTPAQAGRDAGRRAAAAGDRGDQLRAGRPGYAHRPDERVAARRAGAAPTTTARRVPVRLSPVQAAPATTRSCVGTRASALPARGDRAHRFQPSASRATRRRCVLRRARAAATTPLRPTR